MLYALLQFPLPQKDGMRQFFVRALEQLSRLFFKHTVFLLTILLCIGAGVALSSMSSLSSHLIRSQALQNAAQYAHSIKEARTLYSSETVDRIKNLSGVHVDANYTIQPNGIPLPATYLLELGNRISETKKGYQYGCIAIIPFPGERKKAD